MANLAEYHNPSIGYLNIQGLHNKNGCKLPHLIPELKCDIEIWSETWACKCKIEVEGYDILAKIDPQKKVGVSKGRKSGGICVLVKSYLFKQCNVIKKSNNFIWVEIHRSVIKNLEKNLIICAKYIHDITSVYYSPNIFQELSKDILDFGDQNTPLLIIGDMNARTSTSDENPPAPSIDHSECYIETENYNIQIKPRNNCDKEINAHGNKIIEICKSYNLQILNGRMDGDPLGNLTYFNENLGASAVDYCICSQNFFKYISNFMTLPQNELSDHCKIVTEIKGGLQENMTDKDNYDWKNLDENFIWDENCKEDFIKFLEGANHEISEINQRIEAGLVNSTGKKIQELYQNAAKFTFSSKTKIKQNTKSRKTNSKLWFDLTLLDC